MIEKDSELLARYVADRSEAAFTELVRRRLPLVYSIALRQLEGDTPLAEDVTQKVFADLARKAGQLAHHPALSGWLYRSTQFEAIEALRAERRRRIREQESLAMQELFASGNNLVVHEHLRPILDRAMAELPERDRHALMLRFFEECRLAEVGRRLAISKDAARMRVDRALERLKNQLAARGVSSTATALGLALAGQAALVPPAHLATAIASVALAAEVGAGAAAADVFGFMSVTKAIVAGVGLVTALSVGAYLVNSSRSPSAADPRPAATATTTRPNRARIDPTPSANLVQQTTAPRTAVAESSNDFAREFARLMGEPETNARRNRLRTLLTAWGKTAPHDALAAVQSTGLSALEKESHDLDVFTGWAASDPEAAWIHAPKTTSPRAAWIDAPRAVSLRTIMGPPENLFFQKIAAVMAENGRAAQALKLITDEPNARFRLSTVNSMVQSMVKNDFAGALALARSSPWRVNIVAVASGTLAREFPDLALDLATEFPDVRDQALSSVFFELGKMGNARVTADWIARETSPNLRERALRYYFDIRGEITDQIRAEALAKIQKDAAR